MNKFLLAIVIFMLGMQIEGFGQTEQKDTVRPCCNGRVGRHTVIGEIKIHFKSFFNFDKNLLIYA